MAAVNTNSHTESQFLLRRDLPLFSCQSDTDRYSALDICLAAERMRGGGGRERKRQRKRDRETERDTQRVRETGKEGSQLIS